MRKLLSILFKSKEDRKIDHILKKVVVKETVKTDARCLCEIPGVSGYCHKHRTDWL